MKPSQIVIVSSAFAAMALTSFTKPVPKDQRTIIPLTIDYDKKHHDITPVMQVSVNTVTVNVVFDTGSFGLRLLKGSVKDAGLDISSRRIKYGYGSGKDSLKIAGPVANSKLTIGTLSEKGIKIMLVDSLKYGVHDWSPTLDSSIVQSRHFRDIQGIMGVSLRAARNSHDVANPLAQLPGNGAYIVHFPQLGATDGQVIVNPIDKDLEGYTFFQLDKGVTDLPNGMNSWDDKKFNGTVVINGTLINGPTMIDSGSPTSTVFSNAYNSRTLLSADTKVQVSVADYANPQNTVGYTFTVADKEVGKDRMYTNGSPRNRIILGTAMFFMYDVYFDQVRGIIGLKRK